MIDFVEAWNGQLYFKAETVNHIGTEVKWWYIKTVEEGVNLFIEQGYSSHMDYGKDMCNASEAGFPHDNAAMDMLKAIIEEAELLCEEIG